MVEEGVAKGGKYTVSSFSFIFICFHSFASHLNIIAFSNEQGARRADRRSEGQGAAKESGHVEWKGLSWAT